MAKQNYAGEVVRLFDLPDLTEAAELAGQPEPEFAARLASLPDGIHGIGFKASGKLRAVALDLEREIARSGKRSLVRLRTEAEDPTRWGLMFVAWAEESSRRQGARRLCIGIEKADGLSELLEPRGYRRVESFITMQRTSGSRECPPIPPGITEQSLRTIGDAKFLEIGNAAFEDVPGAFPLSASDFVRVRTEAGFRDGLVKVISDAEGPVGFLRGSYVPGHPGEVEAIGVMPRARGKKLGRWLLRRTEELLEQEGAPSIQLLVAATNKAAVSLYRKDGYVEISRRDSWERVLED